jgi:DNA-directed RNA polymerase
MRKYITDSLHLAENTKEKDNLIWYSKLENQTSPLINNKDISLVASCIYTIIHKDFEKIKNLMKYLKNIATVLTLIGLPIVWSLPHGLIVRQSYLEVKSTSIRPFLYSKTKINIQVVNKDKYDKSKQIRALMPNLIHSLDALDLH